MVHASLPSSSSRFFLSLHITSLLHAPSRQYLVFGRGWCDVRKRSSPLERSKVEYSRRRRRSRKPILLELHSGRNFPQPCGFWSEHYTTQQRYVRLLIIDRIAYPDVAFPYRISPFLPFLVIPIPTTAILATGASSSSCRPTAPTRTRQLAHSRAPRGFSPTLPKAPPPTSSGISRNMRTHHQEFGSHYIPRKKKKKKKNTGMARSYPGHESRHQSSYCSITRAGWCPVRHAASSHHFNTPDNLGDILSMSSTPFWGISRVSNTELKELPRFGLCPSVVSDVLAVRAGSPSLAGMRHQKASEEEKKNIDGKSKSRTRGYTSNLQAASCPASGHVRHAACQAWSPLYLKQTLPPSAVSRCPWIYSRSHTRLHFHKALSYYYHATGSFTALRIPIRHSSIYYEGARDQPTDRPQSRNIVLSLFMLMTVEEPCL